MTAPEVPDAVSAADEAEYVALCQAREEPAPVDHPGCGCVPVFHEPLAEVPQPRSPGSLVAAEGPLSRADVPLPG